MTIKKERQLPGPHFRPVLCFLIASLFIGCSITILLLYGWEIVRIFLFTAPVSGMTVLVALPLFSGAVFCLMALLEIRGQSRHTAPLVALFTVTASAWCILFFHSRGVRMTEKNSPRPRPAISAGPFVQFGPFSGHRAENPSGSAVIWWAEPHRSAGVRSLVYRTGNGRPVRKFEEPGGDGHRHAVILRGLSADTEYWYGIDAEKGPLHRFRTAPSGKSRGFRFLCMGDTGNTKRGGGYFSYQGDVAEAAVNYYRRIGAEPSFKLHLGDMVKQGSDTAAWEVFFRDERDFCASHACMITVGNHECLGDRGERYSYFFAHPSYYSFDYGSARFLVLHPFDGMAGSFDGPVVSTGKEQYLFVKRELERPRGGKWIIVSIHIPIASTGDYNHNEILMAQYLELFRREGVDLVVSGHDHHFDSFYFPRSGAGDGMLMIVAGTGGSALDGYIMTRDEKRWKGWRHDRMKQKGLYQDDAVTRRHHLYGEISWGFLDVLVEEKKLAVTYHRWLDYGRFLKITGQNSERWEMVPLTEETKQREKLSETVPVKRYVLYREIRDRLRQPEI